MLSKLLEAFLCLEQLSKNPYFHFAVFASRDDQVTFTRASSASLGHIEVADCKVMSSIFDLADKGSAGHLVNQDLSLLGATGNHLLGLGAAEDLEAGEFFFDGTLHDWFACFVPLPRLQSRLLNVSPH